MIKSFFRITRYGIQGFRRNIWLSIIAIITMTLTITTITIFALGHVVINNVYQKFNSQIDYNIFLKDSASEEDIDLFRQQVDDRPEVAASEYVSKDEALKRFDRLNQNNPNLKGIITPESNPLPREIDVKFGTPKQIETFNQFVSDPKFDQLVEKTSYLDNRNLINNYVQFTNFLRVFGISFTLFFVMIAVLVILNTIRLTIYSRREEIEIMRLVGATRSYIRGPFLIEGVLFGILGALFSAMLAWVFLYQFQNLLASSFGSVAFISSDLFISTLGDMVRTRGFNPFYSQLVLLQVAIGMFLGMICSFIATRRYLKE